jgi:hypothetical protein
MHSINDNNKSLGDLPKAFPERPFIGLDLYNDKKSFKSLTEQKNELVKLLQTYEKTYAANTGYDLVCHSQGALICRLALQSFPSKCRNFVSLGGPQMGIYGPSYLKFVIAQEKKGYLQKAIDNKIITLDMIIGEYSFLNGLSKFIGFSPSDYWRNPKQEESAKKSFMKIQKYFSDIVKMCFMLYCEEMSDMVKNFVIRLSSVIAFSPTSKTLNKFSTKGNKSDQRTSPPQCHHVG